jgi:hypothetical protein
MAEIEIEPRQGRSPWMWVIVVLVVLAAAAAVWWFLVAGAA